MSIFQDCEMKFGSWTYNGFKVNFMLQQEDGGDISEFIPNGEWKLLGKLGNPGIGFRCEAISALLFG